MTSHPSSGAQKLLLVVIGLFVLGRFFGSLMGADAWSFHQWEVVSWIFPALWLLAFAGLAAFVHFRQDTVGNWFKAPVSVAVPLVVLITLFWIFRFDTFLFGGGNLRVGQIAKFEQAGGIVIYSWYEFGCTALAHGLYLAFKALGLEANVAGANAWRFLTYLSTIFAMAASVQLARIISRDNVRRVFTFIIIFFGGQTLLYFGYVGMEPIVVPVTLWFAYYVCRRYTDVSSRSLLWLWLILAAGVILHVSLVFLLPAAVYVSVGQAGTPERRRHLALIAGIISYIAVVVVLYIQASGSFALQARILMLHGKTPFLDYGVLSVRHIADLLQIFFLAVPTLLVVKWLSAQRIRKLVPDQTLMAAWLMALGGATAVIVLDPNNSIVVDLPRLLAYLSPFGVVTALVLNDVERPEVNSRLRLLPLAAAAAIMFPLSYLPAYVNIYRADPYVSDYLSHHEGYYKKMCYNFRDAFFYIRDLDKSNAWEQASERKSPERINLTGSAYLIGGGQVSEGIKTLHQLIARDLYWAEPRSLLARAEMAGGQYRQALVQIDTALMLEPYERQHQINRYECYRDLGNYDEALAACRRGLELYPADTFMTTDLMILNYRAGNYRTADSVAEALIAARPRHAYAHFIKGALADRAGNRQAAVKAYQLFLEMATTDPDIPRVLERIRELTSPPPPADSTKP
jgi:tetratricopeptide (TPR) repeat protein